MEDVKAIIRELLKYEDVAWALVDSDYAKDKEYSFSAKEAVRKLKDFAEAKEENEIMPVDKDGDPFGIFIATFKEKEDGPWDTGYYINRQDDIPILLTFDGKTVGAVWDLSINWGKRAF